MLQRIHITVKENISGMENVCRICGRVFATICILPVDIGYVLAYNELSELTVIFNNSKFHTQ